MDIVTTSFLVFVGIFALRGAMLGFINLFARIISLIAGYFVAYAFRTDVAMELSKHMENVSPYVLQVIASVGLFFGTTLVVGLGIKLLISVIRKMNGALDTLLAGKSLHGRIAGAACNSAIGAFIFLIGLWGYGYAGSLAGLPPVPAEADKLQTLANQVGDRTFSFLLQTARSGQPQQMADKARQQTPAMKEAYQRANKMLNDAEAAQLDQQLTNPVKSGSGYITSSSDPNKVYKVDDNGGFKEMPVREVKEIVEPATLQTLLDNPVVREKVLPQMQELVNNPEVIQQALEENAPFLADMVESGAIRIESSDPESTQRMMEQVKGLLNNPEALQEALSDPRVQQMMENLRPQE